MAGTTSDSAAQGEHVKQQKAKAAPNGAAHDDGPIKSKFGLITPKPTARVIDPSKVSLDKLRLNSTCSTARVEKASAKVELRRPYNTAYCRVLDGLENRLDVAIFEPKKSGVYYLVTTDAQPDFPGPLANYTLFVTIEKAHPDRPFLWPVIIPDPGNSFGGALAYSEAAETALTNWTRIEWVASNRKHTITKVTGKANYEPQWPAVDIHEMALAAFGDRIIVDHDHAIVRELAGKWE